MTSTDFATNVDRLTNLSLAEGFWDDQQSAQKPSCESVLPPRKHSRNSSV